MLPEFRRFAGAAGANKKAWPLGRVNARSVVYQALLAAAVGLAAWYLIANAVENVLARRIASGFGFLWREAGFEIGETTFLSYNAGDTYLRALAVGLLNTFRVATLAIFFSTLLGVFIGLARLSLNWLLAKLAEGYIEVVRNVPLVVQLFLVRRDHRKPPDSRRGAEPVAGSLSQQPRFRLSYPGHGAPIELDYPVFTGFNFSGGGLLSPEFPTLFLGLTLYTAAFIAEIVRAGVLAVDRGQFEAAYSLGLNHRPSHAVHHHAAGAACYCSPVTSQYLNFTKNSSLAVAIGYPDLVSIANTTINQTGQAIEGIAIIVLVYLTISLAISGFMNWYNRRFALRGAKL